jgi:hypothetical protein
VREQLEREFEEKRRQEAETRDKLLEDHRQTTPTFPQITKDDGQKVYQFLLKINRDTKLCRDKP